MLEVGILSREMTLDVRRAQWHHKSPYEREAGGQSRREGVRPAEAGAEETLLPRSGRRGPEPERGGRQPGKGQKQVPPRRKQPR